MDNGRYFMPGDLVKAYPYCIADNLSKDPDTIYSVIVEELGTINPHVRLSLNGNAINAGGYYSRRFYLVNAAGEKIEPNPLPFPAYWPYAKLPA